MILSGVLKNNSSNLEFIMSIAIYFAELLLANNYNPITILITINYHLITTNYYLITI